MASYRQGAAPVQAVGLARVGCLGSKATSGLCQPLIAMMPHATCIETHLGGGALMRRKPPALRNVGIDRDARALARFECEYPVELVHGRVPRFVAGYAVRGHGAQSTATRRT